MKAKFDMPEPPFTGKEFGQMRNLRMHMGDLTQPLIEWVVDPTNWWFFCQEVRKGWKTIFVPDYPDIGFLLGRRGVALRVMRAKLSNSAEGAEFVKKVEAREFQSIKTLLLTAYANGDAARVAKIEAATTLVEMQKVFLEMAKAD